MYPRVNCFLYSFLVIFSFLLVYPFSFLRPTIPYIAPPSLNSPVRIPSRLLHAIREDRQLSGRDSSWDHDQRSSRGIRDRKPPLLSHRLSRTHRLHQEYDHGLFRHGWMRLGAGRQCGGYAAGWSCFLCCVGAVVDILPLCLIVFAVVLNRLVS